MVLPKGYVNSPATVPNIFGRDIDNIMLIKPDKGEWHGRIVLETIWERIL